MMAEDRFISEVPSLHNRRIQRGKVQDCDVEVHTRDRVDHHSTLVLLPFDDGDGACASFGVLDIVRSWDEVASVPVLLEHHAPDPARDTMTSSESCRQYSASSV